MATVDRPRLRPRSGSRVEHQGRSYVALEDPLGLFKGQVLIPLEAYRAVVRHFDGSKTLAEILDRVNRESGRPISMGELEGLVEQLDRSMVLDGPTVRSFGESYSRLESRPAAFAGRSYPADPSRLREELGRYFAHPQGSDFPVQGDRLDQIPVKAILCPHIDFGRGGPVYTWAYRELVERSDVDVFVILGVAHQHCGNRFALTRKDFETPLGKVHTDRAYVDRLAELAGPNLFDDELAHRTEHSIEFQAVFLQYLLGGRRDFAIVPILVGSFHDLMTDGISPMDNPSVRRMVEALRLLEHRSGKRVAYIGSVDLCHVGPEFGDPCPIDDSALAEIRAFDGAMLDRAIGDDPEGWFSEAAAIDDRHRVCGLAATYTLLHAIGPTRGRILRYDQAVNPSRTCCVSFASVAFEATSGQVQPVVPPAGS